MTAPISRINDRRDEPRHRIVHIFPDDEADDVQRHPEPDFATLTLPDIFTHDKQLRVLSDEVIAALEQANKPNPTLFVQSSKLVTISKNKEGAACITPLTQHALRGIITRAANFYDKPGKGKKGINPPIEVVQDVFSLGSWPFPTIKAIITAPTIRPDGSVLDTAGYDAATELYYQPAPDLVVDEVPAHPTTEDVLAALEAIDDIVHDFPYVSDADRANAYAAMLTPYIRALVGCVPMAIFEAPQQGTGKSLHAEILSIIQTGREMESNAIPPSEEEWSKTLAGLLREGATMIVFDNAVGVLDSAVLASVLTSSIFRPRLLGKISMLQLPNTATWALTANNVRLGADFPRRCYSIRIDSKLARPEKREGFRHPNLKAHTKQVRGKVIHALLTLARAWYAAERPMPEKRVVMGSFDEWASTIAGILHFAGVHDFLGNVQLLHERADVETPLWDGFFTEWERLFGDREVATAEVAKKMDALKDHLPDFLLKLYTDRDKQPLFVRKLGTTLGSQVDVRYTDDGLRLERGRVSHGSQLWRVARDAGGCSTRPPADPPASDQENSV